MVALLVHAILGIAVIVLIVKSNPAIFKRVAAGPQLSTLEIVLWVIRHHFVADQLVLQHPLCAGVRREPDFGASPPGRNSLLWATRILRPVRRLLTTRS